MYTYIDDVIYMEMYTHIDDGIYMDIHIYMRDVRLFCASPSLG